MGKTVQTVQFDDEKINRMQGNITTVLNGLVNIPFLDGILLKDQALGAGTTTVNHKLQRLMTGYLVLKQGAPAVIYANGFNKESAVFISTVAVTVDLWVF